VVICTGDEKGRVWNGTDIDVYSLSFCKPAHVAFREQAIREQ
jgi:hypothetical protein